MKTRFESVDDLALRFFVLIERSGSIRAQDIRAIRGVVCAHCHGGPKTTRKRGRPEPGRWWIEEICTTCGKLWQQDESGEYDVPKQKPAKGELRARPDLGERALADTLDEMRMLAPLFGKPRRHTLERWTYCLTAWKGYLYPTLGSYSAVASYAQACGAKPIDWWVQHSVRHWVHKAREIVYRRTRRRPVRVSIATPPPQEIRCTNHSTPRRPSAPSKSAGTRDSRREGSATGPKQESVSPPSEPKGDTPATASGT